MAERVSASEGRIKGLEDKLAAASAKVRAFEMVSQLPPAASSRPAVTPKGTFRADGGGSALDDGDDEGLELSPADRGSASVQRVAWEEEDVVLVGVRDEAKEVPPPVAIAEAPPAVLTPTPAPAEVSSSAGGRSLLYMDDDEEGSLTGAPTPDTVTLDDGEDDGALPATSLPSLGSGPSRSAKSLARGARVGSPGPSSSAAADAPATSSSVAGGGGGGGAPAVPLSDLFGAEIPMGTAVEEVSSSPRTAALVLQLD